MDNNEIIDAVIKHPAYNRNRKAIPDILKKEKDKYQDFSEEQEDTSNDNSNEIIKFI
jgi:hypothetical protein